MKNIQDILNEVSSLSHLSDKQLLFYDSVRKPVQTYVYDNIEVILQDWIDNNLTIDDVAHKYDVCRTTIQRAMKSKGLTFPVQERVRKDMEKLQKAVLTANASMRQARHADEKIQDIKDGMSVHEWTEKWGISRASYYGYVRRHNLKKGLAD